MLDRLDALAADYAAAVAEAFDAELIVDASDAEVMHLLGITGRMQRTTEAAQVEATVAVRSRSEGLRGERMTTTYGCDRPADLLRVVLRTDHQGASRLVRAAGLTTRTRGITDGEFLPARYDELRGALNDGVIGLAGLLAATRPLESGRGRILEESRVEADLQLAAFARGEWSEDESGSGDPAPPPTPDEIARIALLLAAYLDPDGAEPKDELAARERGLWLGAVRDGTVPVRGRLMPETAAQLQRLLDSLLNPRTDAVPAQDGASGGVCFEVSSPDDDRAGSTDPDDPDYIPEHDGMMPVDNRTAPQKRHDALASILAAAARGGELPDLGGAAPTLVVTVTASDYISGRGWAWPDGVDAGVPIRVAAQTACAGGIQRVLFDERGRIVSLGTSGRIFNALQRRAIIARDGTCIIPGCTVPATWCEIHHVQEHAQGGPTHVDNGVALCWHHHRTLHLSEWQVRVRHGIPELRGPTWWDGRRRWRPVRRRPRGADKRLRSSPAASCG